METGRSSRRIAGVCAATLAALLVAFVAVAPAGPAARTEIIGNLWIGETISSTTAGDTAVYKWQRCDPDLVTCADSDRSDPNWETVVTNNGDPTYTIQPADLGHLLRVQAKGTSLGEQFTPSAPVGPVLAGPPGPPVNLSLPTISGDATEGKSVTANPGTWRSNDEVTFSFAWERCTPTCAPIDGADEQRYDPTAEDVGASLRVKVTATNSDGETSEYSDQTGEVAVAPPVIRETAVVDPSCPLPVAQPGEGVETVDHLTNVPIGTKIDVSSCPAELITVRNQSGKTQSVAVAGSEFKFLQRQQRKAVVVLKLGREVQQQADGRAYKSRPLKQPGASRRVQVQALQEAARQEEVPKAGRPGRLPLLDLGRSRVGDRSREQVVRPRRARLYLRQGDRAQASCARQGEEAEDPSRSGGELSGPARPLTEAWRAKPSSW